MSLMNPRLPDGRHEWRDGRFIVKEGLRLKIDGTSTLAGRYVPPSLPLTHACPETLN